MHEYYKVDISDDEELATSHRENKEKIQCARVERRSQIPSDSQAVMVASGELNIIQSATGSAQVAGPTTRFAKQEEASASRNQHKLLTKTHSVPNEQWDADRHLAALTVPATP